MVIIWYSFGSDIPYIIRIYMLLGAIDHPAYVQNGCAGKGPAPPTFAYGFGLITLAISSYVRDRLWRAGCAGAGCDRRYPKRGVASVSTTRNVIVAIIAIAMVVHQLPVKCILISVC